MVDDEFYHVRLPLQFHAGSSSLMQPRYSSMRVTQGLQDLLLRKPHLQALLHELHHLPT